MTTRMIPSASDAGLIRPSDPDRYETALWFTGTSKAATSRSPTVSVSHCSSPTSPHRCRFRMDLSVSECVVVHMAIRTPS
ncbi:hypothetical protein ACFFR3_31515 [Nonomuraea salmonea]|uniref:Uncharacterized protein n=1 Tax=Nonomuraea salmonea TaxID=46181 RepID=A0ABV5NUP0_9ACTN